MGKIIFLTGPVRSGKSRHAVELGRAWGGDVVFVGTWRNSSDDSEMTERVRKHREERPAWRVLEAPDNIGAGLKTMSPAPSGVIVDCLTLWASARLETSDELIFENWDAQLEFFRVAPWSTVIVGNEIGWAPVPETPILRRFRDLVGTLGQRTAAAADEAWLFVAGCAVKLK